MTIGERLKELRNDLKLSQEELAKQAGYKRQGNLSLYENDKKLPEVQTIVRYARAAGLLPSEFMKDVITDYDRLRAGFYDSRTKDDGLQRKAETLARETEHVIQKKERATASRGEKKTSGKRVAKA